MTLWLEYENSSSLEAALAHELDKLEMILQANEYEEQQNVDLDDFFQSTKDSFSHPEVNSFILSETKSRMHDLVSSVQTLSWANELRGRRKSRLNSQKVENKEL